MARRASYPSKRLFQNDFLESFTHVNPAVPAVLFVPLVMALLGAAFQSPHLDFSRIVGMGIAGLLTWTFTEYTMHRFVFHWELPGAWGARIHTLIHGIHHDEPQDPTRLVMPPILSIVLASLFYLGFKALLGPALVLPFYAFFLIGYLCYDYTHYYVHHFIPTTRWGKLLKSSHMNHHYVSPDARYGVSSPLWDYVFGTFQSVRRQQPSSR